VLGADIVTAQAQALPERELQEAAGRLTMACELVGDLPLQAAGDFTLAQAPLGALCRYRAVRAAVIRSDTHPSFADSVVHPLPECDGTVTS